MSASGQASMKDHVTKERLVTDLRKLGVREGDHLNVKASLKSIGFVEGGVGTLIAALREMVGPTGTIFTDAFVDAYPLPLSEADKQKVARPDSKSYAGALSNAMLAHPDSWRSPHPVQKFVGIGHLAEELTQAHGVESPAYELLKELAARGGRNLKIGADVKVPGVGTTHVAIETLGIKRHRQATGLMYETPSGEIEFFEVFWSGGCSQAWLKYYPEYEKIGAFLGVGTIGAAPAKLSDMAKTLEWELDKIAKDPASLICDRPDCRICALEYEFSHKSWLRWAFHRAVYRIRQKLGMG